MENKVTSGDEEKETVLSCDNPVGSVEATVVCGESDVKLHIQPIVAHDRLSLIAALQSVKKQLNESLTELINENKASAGSRCSSKQKASAVQDSEEEADEDSSGEEASETSKISVEPDVKKQKLFSDNKDFTDNKYD